MNVGAPCPIGAEITSESRCLEASKGAWKLGLNSRGHFYVGNWTHVPFQCSVNYVTEVLHWNKNLEKTQDSGRYDMICETGKK